MVLPKLSRLIKKRDIDSVFKTGRTVKGSFLFAKFIKNDTNRTRIVFIIPSKYVPSAVKRNKIKRFLSEEIRSDRGIFNLGLDVIVVVSRKITDDQMNGLLEDLSSIVSGIK